MKQENLLIILVILLSVTIPTVRARSIDNNGSVHRMGWNVMSGNGYYEDETISVKCERSVSQYIDLGTVKADEDGTWRLYFSIEDIDYWPTELGKSRIIITVFSSRGIPIKLFLEVFNDINKSIFPPRGYFQTPVYPENRIINDILWSLYINPDIASSIYKEVSMKQGLNDRRFYKNLHFDMRDK